MAKTDFKSIDHYHELFPPEIVERMEKIRKVVHRVVPEVDEVISYQIPCFKHNGYLVYYSAYTNHISLSYPYSKGFLQEFADDLKGYKFSKSAIQFPNDEPLPLDVISRMIAFRKTENDAMPKKKK